MAWDEEDDNTIYKVVINHEEQYSIWPADRRTPRGWRDIAKKGTRQQCFNHIEEVWTDMRPGNLRRKLAETEARIKKDAGG